MATYTHHGDTNEEEPYEETLAERDLRHLFDALPFQTAEYAIHSILPPTTMTVGDDNSSSSSARASSFVPSRIMKTTIVPAPLRRVLHVSHTTAPTTHARTDAIHHEEENDAYSKLFAPLLAQDDECHDTIQTDDDRLHTNTNANPTTQAILVEEENDVHPRGIVESKQNKKRGRQNFKISVAYKGADFCGWQIQPDNPKPSVQQSLIDILDPMLRSPPPPATAITLALETTSPPNSSNISSMSPKKKGWNKTKSLEKPVNIRVCGRTDAGVSAMGQVCRVRTFSSGVDATRIQDEINHGERSMPLSIRCTRVEAVDDRFHPTFSATCRAYAYIIDISPHPTLPNNDTITPPTMISTTDPSSQTLTADHVPLLNAMLQTLEGMELDYFGFSYGKVKTTTTLCTLHRARASLVETVAPTEHDKEEDESSSPTTGKQRAICIELVGDRFLRRMVRILVATAIREVLQAPRECLLQINGEETIECAPNETAEDDWPMRLLSMVRKQERELTAKASPPNGLLFVGADFQD